MRELSENIYPIRGVLQGLIEKSFSFDETEELINGFIKAAMEKGYSHGVIDELKRKKSLPKHTAEEWAVIRDLGCS